MVKDDIFQKELSKISRKHSYDKTKLIEKIKNNSFLKQRIEQYNLSDDEIAFFILELTKIIRESEKKGEKVIETDFKRDPLTKKIVFFERYATHNLRESVSLLKNIIYPELGEPFYNIDATNVSQKYLDSDNWNYLATYLKKIDFNIKNWLYIYGNILSGKTEIMSYIAKIINTDNSKIAFATVNNIYSECINIFNQKQNKFSETKTVEFMIEKIANVDYLFLEDLGMEEGSTWFATNVLLKILEYRMKYRLVTFFSSTLNLVELKNNYLQRIQKNTKIDSNVETMKINKLIKIIEINLYKTIKTKENND